MTDSPEHSLSGPTSLQHSTKPPGEKSPQSTPQTLKGSSKIEETTTTAAQASPKPADSEEGAGELDTFTKMSEGDDLSDSDSDQLKLVPGVTATCDEPVKGLASTHTLTGEPLSPSGRPSNDAQGLACKYTRTWDTPLSRNKAPNK